MFHHLAFPLHRLTEKKAEFHWSGKCQDTFDALKKLLTEGPVLPYPNDDGEFFLDTDASGVGIRAVLSQIQYGKERVIAYSSKSLNAAEKLLCDSKGVMGGSLPYEAYPLLLVWSSFHHPY